MQFLSWADLAKRRSTSVSTEKRRLKNDPRHPRPVPMSPGRVAFPEPETDKYDLLLIAERDAALVKDGESGAGEGAEASAA